jgi:anti-anti-sigma factor
MMSLAQQEGLLCREVNGWYVIEVDNNSVDYRVCEQVKSFISSVVSSGNSKIVLNLEKVSFMDSAGLGVVLHGKRACEGNGGQFTLCCVQGYVQNLMKLTNLVRAVRVYKSEEEACK